MTTDNLEMPDEPLTPAAPPAAKTFSEAEVQDMMKKRRERDAENLRLQHEENKRLKERLEQLEKKMQQGTATDAEMAQVQAAKTGVAQAQAQGLTNEQALQMAKFQMQQEELGKKIIDAKDKDPEFARLLKEGNQLFLEDLGQMTYLPNAPAVIKHLLKDKKAYALFRAAQHEGLVSTMTVLNNLSDRFEQDEQKPAPSQFEPSPLLSDASDNDQLFDESDYISKKY